MINVKKTWSSNLSIQFGKITKNNPTFYWFFYNNLNFWLTINNPNYKECFLIMHQGKFLPIQQVIFHKKSKYKIKL